MEFPPLAEGTTPSDGIEAVRQFTEPSQMLVCERGEEQCKKERIQIRTSDQLAGNGSIQSSVVVASTRPSLSLSLNRFQSGWRTRRCQSSSVVSPATGNEPVGGGSLTTHSSISAGSTSGPCRHSRARSPLVTNDCSHERTAGSVFLIDSSSQVPFI